MRPWPPMAGDSVRLRREGATRVAKVSRRASRCTEASTDGNAKAARSAKRIASSLELVRKIVDVDICGARQRRRQHAPDDESRITSIDCERREEIRAVV